MDETRFWEIVDGSRADKPSVQKRKLKASLSTFDASEIEAFAAAYDVCLAKLERRRIWGAGLILNAGYCSDDGFEYFRHWIIAHGSEAFRVALADADGLVAYPPKRSGGSIDASFEEFGYIAADVYEDMTGDELSVDDCPFDVPDDDFSGYSAEDLARDLPRLWQAHGEHFNDDEGDASTPPGAEQAEVAGLGTIRVGDVLVNKAFGQGIVRVIWPNGRHENGIIVPDGEAATCVIDFGGKIGEKPMMIGKPLLHLWSRP